jgi:ATP synthase protein I
MSINSETRGLMGKEARRMWLAASRVSYIGIFFGVAICIGFFFGRWLDTRWHTAPWLSLVGLLVGIASGFRELIRIAGRIQREQGTDEA